MSQIVLDRAHAIAFARVSGFLDAEQIIDISRRMDRMVSDLGPNVSRHRRLIDLTDSKVAPLEAMESLGREIIHPARSHLRAKRVAYFGARPLVEQQIRRLCTLRPELALFKDRASAISWLSCRER